MMGGIAGLLSLLSMPWFRKLFLKRGPEETNKPKVRWYQSRYYKNASPTEQAHMDASRPRVLAALVLLATIIVLIALF